MSMQNSNFGVIETSWVGQYRRRRFDRTARDPW